jgi:integrase
MEHLTMQDVIDRVMAREDIPERDRKLMASAIRRVCHHVRKEPALVPAEISGLRKIFANPPPHHVLKPGSWSNIKSRVRKALSLVGIGECRKRTFQDLSAGWQSLRSKTLGSNLHPRLSALSHYCSERSIEPEDLSQEVFEAFEAHLLETRLRSEPEKAYALTVNAWNKAVDTIPDWPQVKIHRKPRTNYFSFPWTDYLPSFQEDVEAKFDRLRKFNPFDLSTPRKRIRPKTVKHVEGIVQRFCAACVISGTSFDELKKLSDILEPQRFQAALEWLAFERMGWNGEGSAPDSLIAQIATLRQHGRHWFRHDIHDLTGPERDVALVRIDDQMIILSEIAEGLGKRRRSFTEKNLRTLGHFDDPRTTIAFLNLPIALFNRAAKAKRPTKKDALRMQSAIAIRFLQENPIRIAVLAGLDWSKNFRASSSRKGAPLKLWVPEEATKNRVLHDDPIPVELAKWMDVFMSKYQPLLAAEPSSFLFPGQNGGTKTEEAVRSQIIRTLERESGLRITPHQYRHIAVLLSKDADDAEPINASDIVNHKDPNSIHFYAPLDRSKAMGRFHRHLEEQRGRRGRGKQSRSRGLGGER